MLADQVVVTEDTVFAVSSRSGDIHPRTSGGFYAFDTRFLSSLHLTLENRPPTPLGADRLDHAIASFYATNRGTRNLPAGAISIVRDRYVGVGLHEDISLANHSSMTRTVTLELSFDADFAAHFEARRGTVRKVGSINVETREGQSLWGK